MKINNGHLDKKSFNSATVESSTLLFSSDFQPSLDYSLDPVPVTTSTSSSSHGHHVTFFLSCDGTDYGRVCPVHLVLGPRSSPS